MGINLVGVDIVRIDLVALNRMNKFSPVRKSVALLLIRL